MSHSVDLSLRSKAPARALRLLVFATMFVGYLVASATPLEIDQPKVKWRFKTQGPIRSAAAIADGQLYFGSADGRVYAVDTRDGRLAWRFSTQGSIAAAPAVSPSLVYAVSRDNTLYALDRASGEVRWTFQAGPLMPYEPEWEYFAAEPVVAGDRVYYGAGDGSLYALDAKDGAVDWIYETKGRIRAAPLVADGVVYQPSNDDFVYALAERDGSLIWKFETEGATLPRAGFIRSNIFTKPSLQDGLLVIGSRDSNVYGIDAKSGQKRWSFTYDTTWAMATTIVDGVVYVGWSTNDLVCALDLQTGREIWQFKSGSHTYDRPLVAGDAVYFGSADGRAYCLNKRTGEKRWDYELGGSLLAPIVGDESALYVGCDDGYLYALEDGPAPRLAVFEPTELKGAFQYFVADAAITPYLVNRGFERLGSFAALSEFVAARVEDGSPSVIVFALTHMSPDLLGEAPESGLMRQYLNGGGKVLWFGGSPNQFDVDLEGDFKGRLAEGPGSRLLGLEFIRFEDSGNYYCRTTQAGLNWGLPSWETNTFASLPTPQGVTPLGFDEFGRVGPWLKTFSDKPGSGWVSCRTWGYNTPIQEDDLEIVYQLATYGLK